MRTDISESAPEEIQAEERFAGAGEASMRLAAFTDENCEDGD